MSYLLRNDPFQNAINEGIRRDIDIAIENKCYRGALTLIYAGIDAMAHLNRPETSEFNSPDDFKAWVRTYFEVKGDTDIAPDEWWAARNAHMHTYTPYAKAHSNANIRILAYMINATPHVHYGNKDKNPKYVFVDILGMRDAFFSGIETFFMRTFADAKKKPLIEKRLENLVLALQYGIGHVSKKLKDWAAGKQIVRKLFAFGSRVKGKPRPDSDIDIALVIEKLPIDENELSTWLHESKSLCSDLQAGLPWKLDLQWFDEGGGSTPNVEEAVKSSGQLIYERVNNHTKGAK